MQDNTETLVNRIVQQDNGWKPARSAPLLKGTRSRDNWMAACFVASLTLVIFSTWRACTGTDAGPDVLGFCCWFSGFCGIAACVDTCIQPHMED